MRIIGEQEVAEILSAAECIGVMREALANVERGVSVQFLRTAVTMQPGKILAFMPSYYDEEFMGAKVITVFPGNTGTEYPSHMGQVILYGAEHGEMRGMVDGTAITRIRTGAVSAVATDVLARKDARSLALIGAGAQARSHLAAIRCVREIETVYVYDIERRYAEALAEEIRGGAGVPTVIVCDTAGEAARNADIICTMTHASEPLIDIEDVKLGAHINAVGACAAKDRELGSRLVAKAKFFGDNRESVFAEAGDLLYPIEEGVVGPEHYLGNIAAVMLGELEGRTSDEEITVFEALGLATEDVAAAIYCYRAVCEREAAGVAGAVEAAYVGVALGAVKDVAEAEACGASEAGDTSEANAGEAACAVETDVAEAEACGASEAGAGESVEKLDAGADALSEKDAVDADELAERAYADLMTELQSVAQKITDLNIENGILQNKLFGRKQAKAQIEENAAELAVLTARMEDLKERKEEYESMRRRRQRV